MKQILFTLFFGLVFNVANAIILIANCPDMNTTTNTIHIFCGQIRIGLIIEPESGETLNQSIINGMELDFISNHIIRTISGNDFKKTGNSWICFLNFIPKKSENNLLFVAYLKEDEDIVGSLFLVNNLPLIGPSSYQGPNPCRQNNINNMTLDKNLHEFSFENISNIDNYIHSVIKIYPNPFVDEFTIEYNAEITKIEILDVNGILHYNLNVNPNNYEFRKQINNFNLPKGVYVCRLKSENSEYNLKIIKM